MEPKPTNRLRIAGVLLFILGGVLSGCSSRWSPTDPRLNQTDPASVVVLERWEIGVSAAVQDEP